MYRECILSGARFILDLSRIHRHSILQSFCLSLCWRTCCIFDITDYTILATENILSMYFLSLRDYDRKHSLYLDK